MPGRRNNPKSDEEATTATSDFDDLALRFVDLLNDDQVLRRMKHVLYPSDLANKIDSLTNQVSHLSDQLKGKDECIAALEKRVSTLESDLEKQEQYTRRANVRIQGIEENPNGENTDQLVLDLVNQSMKLAPPLEFKHIERSHRLGSRFDEDGNLRMDEDGNPRNRAIIVRFNSERVRDTVYRARGQLKGFNQGRDQSKRVWINEDLTDTRAALAHKTRLLKKDKKISDCWTTYGKVMIKDLDNNIKYIKEEMDLNVY